MTILLTKSKIQQGKQCSKALYLSAHLKTPITKSQQQNFNQGNEVGVLARTYFTGGILIEGHGQEALDQTQGAIASGALTLFEAAFMHDDVLVRVDILNRSGTSWNLIEVKSTVDIKRQHVEDAAVQAWVLKNSGLSIDSVSIMFLNRDCTFPDLSNLFVTEDVTTEVDDGELPELIVQLKKVLQKKSAPDIDIGPHCGSPYPCPYQSLCFAEKKIPEISVFDIPGLAGKKKWELYAAGLSDLKDVQKAEGLKFTQMQHKMIEVSTSGKSRIDPKAIARELKRFKYPLYYLDFETIGPAVPRYAGTRPYAQVPFQFSCHIQASPESTLSHAEYLHDTMSDPREPLARALVSAIGLDGSVVAYNKAFEAGCLKKLAELFPDLAPRLLDIAARLVDPLPIFRAHVYTREFAGSFSIKSVAPALLGSTMSYEGMAVSDGTEAQAAYEELIAPGTASAESTRGTRKLELRTAMLEYCRQDTLAMVELVGWLSTSATPAQLSLL